MKLIVTVDSIGTAPFGFVGAVSRDEDTMIEVWKGIQKQLEEKGYKIITLSVEEYKES
jgi:hypothetical protein